VLPHLPSKEEAERTHHVATGVDSGKEVNSYGESTELYRGQVGEAQRGRRLKRAWREERRRRFVEVAC